MASGDPLPFQPMLLSTLCWCADHNAGVGAATDGAASDAGANTVPASRGLADERQSSTVWSHH